jgi:hypothetical protein
VPLGVPDRACPPPPAGRAAAERRRPPGLAERLERIDVVTRSEWLWPTIIAASAAAAALVTFGDLPSPIRPVVALWFLLVCPGMAFVRLVRTEPGVAGWMLAVALSLAIDGLVAGAMVYTGLWSPRWGLVAVIVVSVVGAALQVVLARRARRDRAVDRDGPVPPEAIDVPTEAEPAVESTATTRSPIATRR